MPSADDFDLDNLDEQPSVAVAKLAAEATPEGSDPWALSKSPPKSKKKKSKRNAAAKHKSVEDGDESSAYPKSITPSPPADHGVKLRSSPPPSELHNYQHTFSDEPQLVDLHDETAAEEEVESASVPKPAPKSSPAASPAIRSPRPAVAKPVLAHTPPNRPVSLHGASTRDRNNSLIGHRPPALAAHQMPPRRESFANQRPRFVEPPPPHMPQAHFFGLPDLGIFTQKTETGRPAGSEGYCCRLDTFANAGDEVSAKKARDALLVGCEGGLEVFRLLPNKLEVVGRLEGLRGAVIRAKILPHVDRGDDIKVLRPLVAVAVHGPMLDDRRDSGPEGEEVEVGEAMAPTHFQTSVEVYSLQTQCYIATIYNSAPVAIEQPMVGQVSSLPNPVGDLELDAQGQFITVTSGKSGEIMVFTQLPVNGKDQTRFRCIGKFWTSIQTSIGSNASRPPIVEGGNKADSKEEPRRAIYSLTSRWLAIVPPSSSSTMSVQGIATMTDSNPSPPGITTHAAPPQPLVTCEVVGTDVEGTWSRLGRQAAQGLMKYSQRGIEMGLQSWKELTHPSPPGGRQIHDRSGSREESFPPTKAPIDDPSRLANEPALVSIIDLQNLLQWEEHRPKHLPAPLATFALLDGCNFLSLSSLGTRLLTSSRKGEVSIVWDLVQAFHGIPRRIADSDGETSTSPSVKQLLRIPRNSPSTVLNCAWTIDDDALALLTAHGTIHLHEVPIQPCARKRKRINTTSTQAAEKAGATVSLSSGLSPPSAGHGFFGSIKTSWQTVSTQVNSMRSSNAGTALGLPTTFAGFRETAAAGGNAASRAVARGLSQGYTAAKGGASDYWHADDNKIRHAKELQEACSDRSIRWIRRNNTSSVAIACGGSVHVHPVQRASRRKGDTIISGLKNERYAHKAFPLPSIITRSDMDLQGTKSDACRDQGPHGFWSLRYSTPCLPTGRQVSARAGQGVGSTGTDDVESNPPHCPFHVDARVNLLGFDEQHSGGSQHGRSLALEDFESHGHGGREDAWLFGGALPACIKTNEQALDELDGEGAVDAGMGEDDDDDDNDDDDVASQMESKLTIQAARRSQDGDQIVINTRRRGGRDKGRGQGAAAVHEREFDVLDDMDDF